ncbi:MAG: hypothetical protein GY796_36390 [Chloroflexi bacterium]|nr:hypothetical protein [Chloroflexota bacterium]
MSFNWLKNFHQEMEKPDNYAQKTLAQYRLGMKAKGSIAGVRIEVDKDGCVSCGELDEMTVYHPDDAPYIPLSDCTKGNRCGCVYRPVMTYEVGNQ